MDKSPKLRTGTLHIRLLRAFAEDMRHALGDDFLDDEPAPWLSLRDYRTSTKPMPLHADRYRYKARYQYRTYLKRFTTSEEDVLKDVRKLLAFDAFEKTQNRIANPQTMRPLPSSVYRVVQRARKIIKGILGVYDETEHRKRCRFGKRASTGVCYADSYLHTKAGVLSSSPQHYRWFFKQGVPNNDILLSEAIRECMAVTDKLGGITYGLQLTAVPKKWDADRTILKNTTIGAFYTAGLEAYMVDLLNTSYYDLRHRAEKHARLIAGYSVTRSHVTGDLSSASDSFTSWLIRMLFPYSWYKAMNFGRIKYYVNEGDFAHIKQMSSFMTMGIGFTFPTQTIAFYAILKAICELTDTHGTVSVFGDDLIYPRSIHNYVTVVLERLGFILNKDKTFVNEYFRESCGSDYYAGLPVRPYQPKGQAAVLRGEEALSYLYKTINGWTKRWDRCEIPTVLKIAETECLRFTTCLHQVPPSWPDTSGIHLEYPVLYQDPVWMPIEYDRNKAFTITAVFEKHRLRKVPVQLIYLWDTLRKDGGEPADYPWTKVEDSTVLQWRSTKARFKGKDGAKKRLLAFVSRKGVSPLYAVTSKCSPNWK